MFFVGFGCLIVDGGFILIGLCVFVFIRSILDSLAHGLFIYIC